MRVKRLFISILLCVLSLSTMNINAAASDGQYILDVPSSTITRSYDSSFTLDFSSSTTWTLNFDNNVFGPLNHRYVSISYLSCNPSNSNAKVSVVLYIDEDGDGTYAPYDPDGGYTYDAKVGDTIKITLPYEGAVKSYRLVMTNKTTSVTSGSFSVITSRS